MELDREKIIKALECCKSFRDFYMCDICPYYRLELADDENCTNRLSQDALALINSQEQMINEVTEEIDSLKQCMEHEHASFMETFGEYGEKCERLAEENERLKAEVANRPHKLIITKKEKQNDRTRRR